jgi:hypothetical protein
LPKEQWEWFCLDRVAYHGKLLTIVWDKTGNKYRKGKGLTVWVNGKKKFNSLELQPALIQL